MSGRQRRTNVGRDIGLVLMLVLLSTTVAAAQQKPESSKPPKAIDNYDELYHRYLQSARAVPSRGAGPDITWMASLATDPRASHVNDLVTVRVVESIVAKNQRQKKAA